MIVLTVAQSARSLSPQIYLVSSVAGFIFGMIASYCINFSPLRRFGHFIYPLGIGFSTATALNMYGQLHGNVFANLEFFRNRVISNMGTAVGFTTGFLIGHAALSLSRD